MNGEPILDGGDAEAPRPVDLVEQVRREVLAMDRPMSARSLVVDASGEVHACIGRARFYPDARLDASFPWGAWAPIGVASVLDHIGTLGRWFTPEEAAQLRFPVDQETPGNG